MRISKGFLLFALAFMLSTASFSFADEIKAIDSLIVQTEKQLQVQKELKEQMVLFKKQKEEFLKGKETKAHAATMLMNANKILETINQNNLQHLFSSDYLEELAFFSSIASKQAPSRPS